MAFKKKPTTSKDVFALTLPLRCDVSQLDQLDKLFRCCNSIKNALIRKELSFLKQLERTRAWKTLQADIAASYKAEEAEKVASKRSAIRADRKLLFQQRKVLLETYGFTASCFEKAVKPMQKHYRKIVHSQVAQKISADVWKMFNDYLYGKGSEIHFSKSVDFFTVEGKSNTTGICYENEVVLIGKKLRIPVIRNKKDWFGYETEALSRDVHYCRIMRKPGPHRWMYFVQLVLAGTPPIKVDKRTGEVMHTLGKGRVGNDIGPQTLATVSDSSVSLAVLGEQQLDTF